MSIPYRGRGRSRPRHHQLEGPGKGPGRPTAGSGGGPHALDHRGAGRTETDGGGLAASSRWACCAGPSDRPRHRVGHIQVLGVGVAGLAESGVLLDAAGRAVCAGDRLVRPARAPSRCPARRARRSAAGAVRPPDRTAMGLPGQPRQTAVAAGQRRRAVTAAHRWASVPEWVVHRLGGDLVREPSLASRTGLVDQATGTVWEEGVAAAGLPSDAAAAAGRRGSAAGTLRYPGLPASAAGGGADGRGPRPPGRGDRRGRGRPGRAVQLLRHRGRRRSIAAGRPRRRPA